MAADLLGKLYRNSKIGDDINPDKCYTLGQHDAMQDARNTEFRFDRWKYDKCYLEHGSTAFFKRHSYAAPKDKCCISGLHEQDGSTCNPNFKDPNEGFCDSEFEDHCSKGDNMFTNERCKRWGNNGNPKSDNAKRVYNNVCGATRFDSVNSIGNKECENWCSRNTQECKTKFINICQGEELKKPYCQAKLRELGGNDDIVNDFCKINPEYEFCNCYNALQVDLSNEPAEIQAALSRPECTVEGCASGLGYKYSNMRDNKNNPCPTSINICRNEIINLNNKGISITDGVVQSCTIDSEITQNISPSSIEYIFESIGLGNAGPILQIFIIFLTLIFVALSIGAGSSLIANRNSQINKIS
jgi:hypothetical protein